jgi:hypothetical protein
VDENKRKRIAEEWWKKTARLHRPEEARRLEEEIRKGSSRLFSLFAERKDGVELADALRDLILNCYAFSQYKGIRRGYLIAQQLYRLESGKVGHRAKAAMVSLIEQHPTWTTKQIFAALDENEKVPFYRLAQIPKHVTRWSDVASEPTYKMFVSRIRAKVRASSRLTGWKKLMRKHEDLRRRPPANQN